MTEITSTNSQPRSIMPRQENPLDKAAPKMKNEATAEQKDLQAVAVEIRTKRLDLLLAVQTETKSTVTLQKGVMQRASGLGVDLGQLRYNGKPITELSQGEAAALVAEDGYFGVTQTSQRLADFVISGGGNDLKRLQAGREGIIKGFKEAEKIWGGELPPISYQTLDKALELIDTRIRDLGGGAVVDVRA
jgi:hypothetical protein